jgi:ferrous iron transport protein A
MTNTLASSPLGTAVCIQHVAGERGYRRRLLELGFLEGAQVRILGVAPMGDPLDIEVRGCRFSLRRAEAELIAVRPVYGVSEPIAAK